MANEKVLIGVKLDYEDELNGLINKLKGIEKDEIRLPLKLDANVTDDIKRITSELQKMSRTLSSAFNFAPAEKLDAVFGSLASKIKKITTSSGTLAPGKEYEKLLKGVSYYKSLGGDMSKLYGVTSKKNVKSMMKDIEASEDLKKYPTNILDAYNKINSLKPLDLQDLFTGKLDLEKVKAMEEELRGVSEILQHVFTPNVGKQATAGVDNVGGIVLPDVDKIKAGIAEINNLRAELEKLQTATKGIGKISNALKTLGDVTFTELSIPQEFISSLSTLSTAIPDASKADSLRILSNALSKLNGSLFGNLENFKLSPDFHTMISELGKLSSVTEELKALAEASKYLNSTGGNFVSLENFEKNNSKWVADWESKYLNKKKDDGTPYYTATGQTEIERTTQGMVRLTTVVQEADGAYKKLIGTVTTAGEVMLTAQKKAKSSDTGGIFNFKDKDKLEDYYKRALKNAEKYAAIQAKAAKGLYINKSEKDFVEGMRATISEISDFEKQLGSGIMDHLDKGTARLRDNYMSKVVNVQDSLDFSKFTAQLSEEGNVVDTLNSKFLELIGTLSRLEGSQDAIEKVEQEYAKLMNRFAKGNIGNNYDLLKDFGKFYNKFENVAGFYTGADDAHSRELELKRRIQERAGLAEVEFQKAAEPQSGDVSRVTGRYLDKTTGQYKTLTATIEKSTGAIRIAQTASAKYVSGFNQFIDSLNNKLASVAKYLMAYVTLQDVWRYFKQGVSTVKEFDTALTEMRKVSDETLTSLKAYQKESFDLADNVGTTALQLQKSTADFMRLGNTLEQAKQNAQTANVLFNVSEFESIEEATNSLISMEAAYRNLSGTEIIDKLNNIGNHFAVSTDGIAAALQRSGSALTTASNDIDESVAMIAAANTVVQDPEKVGNGLRTIALRLTGTKAAAESLQEMGEETDGMIQTESKLRKTIMDATKTASNTEGFDILTDSGQYKSTYEIIQGIADIWEEIGEMDRKTGNTNQNLLLETMAGKNRANILAAMLQSPDVLRSAFIDSQNSEGSAQEELDKYLDSMEGRIQKFHNAAQELATDLLDSDLLKFFIDLGTTGVKALDSLTSGLNAFSLGFSALMTIGTKKAGFDLLQYDPNKQGIHKLQPIWAQMKNRGGALDLENTDANYGKFINSMREADKETVTFSGHYKDLLKMGSIKKIDLAEEFRKDIAEGGNYHGVFDDSLEGYNAWYKAVKSGNDSLKQSFANLGKSIGSIALSGLMSMGITAGIQLLITGINYLATRSQRIIEAGKDARNTIDEITKATQDANLSFRQMGDTSSKSLTQTDSSAKNVGESIDNLTQRYIELRQGTENNANLSLSDSEYEEFLNISNQLAGVLPELQRGTDASGNAILGLSDNAKEASASVKDLYNNYLSLQHTETEKEFAPAVAGLEEELSRMANKTQVSLTADQAKKYLSNQLSSGVYNGSGTYDFIVDWRDYVVYGDEIAKAHRENVEMAIAANDQLAEETKQAMRRSADDVDAEMRAIQQKASGIFSYSTNLITTSEAFGNLNYDLQQDLRASIMDAKAQLLDIWTDSGENADLYSDALYERILAPLSRVAEDSDLQDQLYELMHLDLTKMNLDDVQAEYSKVLSSVFGNVYTENADLFNGIFDIDKYTDIEKKFANRFANSGLFTSKIWDDIEANFSLADMETAYEVLLDDNDHLIDSYEKLKQAIQDARKEALAETSYLNDYTAAHGRAHSAQYDSVKDAVTAESSNMARGIRDENYSKLIGGVDLTSTISTVKTPITKDYDGMTESISALQGELKAFNAVRAEGIKQNADYDFSLDRVLFGNIDLSKTERKIEWTKDAVEEYKDALTSWDLTDIIDSVEKGNKEFSTVLGSREIFYTKNGDAIDVAFSPVMVDGQTGKLLKRNEVMDYIQNKVIGTFDNAGEVTLKAVLDIDKNDQNGKRLIADIGANASITDQIMHFMGVDGSIQTAVQDMLPYFEGLTISAEQFEQFLSNGAVNLYSMFETFDSQQRAMTYFTDDGLGVYSFMKDALEATKGVEDLDGAIVDVGKDGKTSFKKSAKAINELSTRLNISTESAGYLLDAARDIGAVDIGTIYAQAGKNTLNGFLSDLQAVAAAMSDISSNGYMTYDSITNLVTANGAYAEGLVNTSSGMIVNNEIMQELNEQAAQFATADLQGSIDQLRRRYEANNDTLDSYRDKNINVIDVIDKVKQANGQLTDAFDETDAHFQDYQKIWAAYSENTSIGANIEDLRRQQSEIRASVSLMQEYRNALTTPNMNANYLTTQSGMEGTQKLYNQGWVGTDDFLTYAKLIGQNGDDAVTAAENFESNLAEVQRYLTEDATGVYTFFNDAIAKEKDLGVALKDDGGYKINIKNMQAFAKEMGRTTEFCENMILALHDAGELDIDLSVISDGIRSDLSDLGSAPLNATKTIEHAIESIDRMGDSEENALNKIVLGRKAADAYLNNQIEKETVEQYNQSFNGEVQIGNNGALVTDAEQTKKAIGGLTQEVQRYHDETDAAIKTDLFKNLREDVRALSSLDHEMLIKAGVDIDEGATKEQIIDKLGDLTQMSELEKLSLKLDVELPDSLTDDETGKVQELYDAYNSLNDLKIRPNVSTEELSQAQQKVIELGQALEGEDRKEFLAHFGIVTDENGVVQAEATKQKLGEPVETTITYYAPQSMVDRINQVVDLLGIVEGAHDGSVNVDTEYAEEQLEVIAQQIADALNEDGNTIHIGVEPDESSGKYTASGILEYYRSKLSSGSSINVPIGIQDVETNTQTVTVTVNGAAKGAQDVDKLNSSLTTLSQFGALSVNINTAAAIGTVAALQGVLNELGNTVTQPTVSMALANFYSDEKVVEATLKGLSGKTATPHVSLDYQSFIRGAGAVSAGISSLSSLSAYPHVSLSGGGYVNSLLDSIRTKMNNLDGRTATMYINTVRNSSSGGGKYTDALGTVHANASGTANAYAGGTPNNADIAVKHNETALVNELGYESIVRNGKWSLIPGGAHFVNLKKGDIRNSVRTQ